MAEMKNPRHINIYLRKNSKGKEYYQAVFTGEGLKILENRKEGEGLSLYIGPDVGKVQTIRGSGDYKSKEAVGFGFINVFPMSKGKRNFTRKPTQQGGSSDDIPF